MLAHKTCLHKSRVNRISDSGKLIINADMDLNSKRRNLIMLHTSPCEIQEDGLAKIDAHLDKWSAPASLKGVPTDL